MSEYPLLTKRSLLTGAACLGASLMALPAEASNSVWVRPGDLWLDDRGKPIQAHGGSIIRHDGRYYWFGEDRTPENPTDARFVAGYSSADLMTWRYEGQIFRLQNPDGLGNDFVLERPKVFANRETGKFVMYFHLDDTHPDGRAYTYARVGVAVSDRINGPYRYVRSFRPLGKESRDIGQFIDDNGTPYLIFESRPTKGFYIADLSKDYLSVKSAVTFIEAPIEGGAIVHFEGLYYVLGSHLTGWWPNPNIYATAPSLKGPWTTFKDVAPPETNTFQSQSSNLIKVVGSRQTTVIYVGDRWNRDDLADSRYIWMPLRIGHGEMALPQPRDWRIDVRTGEVSFTKP